MSNKTSKTVSTHRTAQDAMDRIMKAKVEALSGKCSKAYLRGLRQNLAMWLKEVDDELGGR